MQQCLQLKPPTIATLSSSFQLHLKLKPNSDILSIFRINLRMASSDLVDVKVTTFARIFSRFILKYVFPQSCLIVKFL